MTLNSTGVRLATGVAMLLASTSAFAQTTAQREATAPSETADATPPDDDTSGDILITAQRRTERLQDVPIAVSAFTDAELQTRQITRTLDLLQFVPNLVGHNNTALGTANAYTLRGLGNTESIATFDVPVGTYVDDVYMSRQGANNFSFFDVERVEVLRGPQGTLFGRNTTGGAINVIMKKPSEDVTGYIEAGYGRYDRYHLRSSIDVPIISGKILSKFSSFYTKAKGYVINQTTGQRLNGDRSAGVRGAIRGFLSDSVTWDLSTDYIVAQGTNAVHFYRPSDERRINFTRLRTDRPLGNIVSSQLSDNAFGNTAKSYSIVSNMEIEAGQATINVITGFRHLYQEFLVDSADSRTTTSVVYNDFDFVSSAPGTTTVLANDSWHDQFSQEVKITGNLGEALSYVGGVFYLKEDNRTTFANVNVPLVGASTVTQDRTVTNGTEAIAGYAQFDWKPFGGLTATAGIRYTDEYKDIKFAPNFNPLPRSGALNQPFGTAEVIAAGIPISQHSKVWTPRFALNYKLTDDVMVFASATKGFKSGGWNARANYAALAVPFTRETIWSYEAGIRSEFFDRRLRVNLTGFTYTDEDFQLPAGYLDPVTNTIIYLTRNFADLKNKGIEGDININPFAGFNAYWSFGIQDARYSNVNAAVIAQQGRCRAGVTVNNCNAGIVTPTGGIAQPVRVPDFSSTLGFNYKIDFNDDVSLTPSGSWFYTKGNWASTSNDPRGFQNAHSIYNAGVALRFEDMGLTIAAECTNCSNKVFKTSFLIYPYLNEPGRWMARVRKDF